MEMGLGHLGLAPSVFYSMSLREFFAAITGQQEKAEQIQRREWERTRWLATCLLQPHVDKGKKLKGTDLIQFSWEKQQQANSLQTFEMLAKGASNGKKEA